MQEALQLLNSRLDTLLEKYNEALTENKALKDTVAQQTRSIEVLNGKLAAVEQQVLALQAGSAITDETERKEVRKQLDLVINEIDKILHTLND